MIRVEAGVVITCPEWNRSCRIYRTVSGVVGVWRTTRRQVTELVGAVVMADGEVLRGTVEWYDRDCIKLTRVGNPNLLIFKQAIKYVYKEGEDANSPNGNHE